jgi:peptide/nickel transport system substrate-binding protein
MRNLSTRRKTIFSLVGCAVMATASLSATVARTVAPVAHAAGVNHRSSVPSGGTVIASEADTPSSLNPYLNQQLSTADIDSAVFDSLVKIDNKGKFIPDIATKWQQSSNGLHFVYFLNHKAKWQDGQRLTSKDVVYTTNLVNNKSFPATSTLGFDHIKTITAAGPYKVAITLTKRYAPFMSYYATSPILPQHILGKIAPAKIRTDASYNTKPLGSGPFKITQYAPADHWTLTANKSYFLGAPHLASIIFRIVPSSNTVTSQLQTGEVTLAGQTSDLSARQFNELKHISSIKTYDTPGFNWQHVDLLETGFLRDVKVRQALMTATDRKRIIQDVALGYGVPQYSDQPPSKKQFYDSAVTKFWNYNPGKAAKMLKADGFKMGSNGTLVKNGTPFNITLYGDSGGGAAITQELELVQREWGQVGVHVTIKLLAAATLFGSGGPLYDPHRLSSKTMQAVAYEWIEGYDPDDQYFWASKEIIGPTVSSGGNFDGYTNAQIDQLTNQGLTATSITQRRKIYDKIQIILAKQVPDIWFYWGDVLSAATVKLHNYKPNPFNYLLAWNAKDWYLK